MLPQTPFQNLPPEWQKLIRTLVSQGLKIQHGEIVIKIQSGKPMITEYTVKRKDSDEEEEEIVVMGLIG